MKLARRSWVTLEGNNALTIREARALIRAGVAAMKWGAPVDSFLAGALEKVAEGLIGAGQDSEAVRKLLD